MPARANHTHAARCTRWGAGGREQRGESGEGRRAARARAGARTPVTVHCTSETVGCRVCRDAHTTLLGVSLSAGTARYKRNDGRCCHMHHAACTNDQRRHNVWRLWRSPRSDGSSIDVSALYTLHTSPYYPPTRAGRAGGVRLSVTWSSRYCAGQGSPCPPPSGLPPWPDSLLCWVMGGASWVALWRRKPRPRPWWH